MEATLLENNPTNQNKRKLPAHLFPRQSNINGIGTAHLYYKGGEQISEHTPYQVT
jgi:hypothetical protein